MWLSTATQLPGSLQVPKFLQVPDSHSLQKLLAASQKLQMPRRTKSSIQQAAWMAIWLGRMDGADDHATKSRPRGQLPLINPLFNAFEFEDERRCVGMLPNSSTRWAQRRRVRETALSSRGRTHQLKDDDCEGVCVTSSLMYHSTVPYVMVPRTSTM